MPGSVEAGAGPEAEGPADAAAGSAPFDFGMAAQEYAYLRALAYHAHEVMAIVGHDLVVRYVSPSVLPILGIEAERLIGRTLTELLPPAVAPVMEAAVRAALEGRPVAIGGPEGDGAELTLPSESGGGRTIVAKVASHPADPSIGGVVINLRDVTAQRAIEHELSRQALHDALTGLPNRNLFGDRLEHALALRRRENGHPVAVLFIDLDGFKRINDTAGHGFGDDLLIALADRLRTCVRPGDTVARLSGDEFAILVERPSGIEEAVAVAERLLEQLDEPFQVRGTGVRVGASIGVALAHPGSEAADLLRSADLAMYRAKAAGKGRVAVFESAMEDELRRRVEIETALRDALDEGDLRVAYEPMVRTVTGRLSAVEALARWDHPELGSVAPAEFIAVAEETGLIGKLGREVLSQACRQAAAWRTNHGANAPAVSVNISGRQFQDPGFLADVTVALFEAQLPGPMLTLEITESVLMDDTATTEVKIAELRNLGVRIAVDDFGTGFSSLSYLARFPVDVLKIDRTFVARLGDDPMTESLIQAVLDLGETFSLETVAEGVETEQQLEALTALGCATVQGYLFSAATTPDDVARLFGQRLPVAARWHPAMGLPDAAPAALRPADRR